MTTNGCTWVEPYGIVTRKLNTSSLFYSFQKNKKYLQKSEIIGHIFLKRAGCCDGFDNRFSISLIATSRYF